MTSLWVVCVLRLSQQCWVNWITIQLTVTCTIKLTKYEFKYKCTNFQFHLVSNHPPRYRISFAAQMSRCQTVFCVRSRCVASSTSTFTFAIGCHVFEKHCFFDTKRRVFVGFRTAATAFPASRISRHIFIIARRIWRIRLLTLVTMSSGQNVHGFGTQFAHNLYRYAFVRRWKRPKHNAHVCDVRYSSTIRMMQSPLFLNASINFRFPGHLTYFLIRIGEFGAIDPQPK